MSLVRILAFVLAPWTIIALTVVWVLAIVLSARRAEQRAFRLRHSPTVVRGARAVRAVRVTVSLLALAGLILAMTIPARTQLIGQQEARGPSSGVLVIDVSSSANGDEVTLGIHDVLQEAANRCLAVGIVLFADRSSRRLAPDTSCHVQEAWASFFTPKVEGEKKPMLWDLGSGTQIGAGLLDAERMLQAFGDTDIPIVLVSDLANSGMDMELLRAVAAHFEETGRELWIIDLKPDAKNRETNKGVVEFKELFGEEAFVSDLSHLQPVPDDPGSPETAEPFVFSGLVQTLLVLIGAVVLLEVAYFGGAIPEQYRTPRRKRKRGEQS